MEDIDKHNALKTPHIIQHKNAKQQDHQKVNLDFGREACMTQIVFWVFVMSFFFLILFVIDKTKKQILYSGFCLLFFCKD